MGLHAVRVEHATPHALYGSVVGAASDGVALPLAS